MKITNINSDLYDQNEQQLNKLRIKDLEVEIDKLSQNFWRETIYLVDEKLMDIIYPPHKGKGIALDNFNLNKAYTYSNEETEIFNFPKQTNYINKTVIGLGMYFSNFNWNVFIKNTSPIPEFYFLVGEIKNPNSNCIFVCPERIHNIAINQVPDMFVISQDSPNPRKLINYKKRTKVFRTLFTAISLHEIAHAYMDRDNGTKINLDDSCKKLIEESFANALAWSQFKKLSDKRIVENFMNSQPFEYSSYRYWIHKSKTKNSLPFLISSWSNKVDPFITEYSFQNIKEALFGDRMYLMEYESLKKQPNDFTFNANQNYNRLIKRVQATSFWSLVGESIIVWALINRSGT